MLVELDHVREGGDIRDRNRSVWVQLSDPGRHRLLWMGGARGGSTYVVTVD